jgi:hypothetical protein
VSSPKDLSSSLEQLGAADTQTAQWLKAGVLEDGVVTVSNIRVGATSIRVQPFRQEEIW